MLPIATTATSSCEGSTWNFRDCRTLQEKSLATELSSSHSSPASLSRATGIDNLPPELMRAIFDRVTDAQDLINSTEAFTHAWQHYRLESIAQFSKQWQRHWFAAAMTGDVKTLDFCVRNVSGFDVNVKNSDGMTALMLACKKNKPNIAKALMEMPMIDVNAENNDGQKSVIFAFHHEDLEIFSALLKRDGIIVNTGGGDWSREEIAQFFNDPWYSHLSVEWIKKS